MTISNTDIGKRVKAIFQHWKKGKKRGESSMDAFAKQIGSNRPSLERVIRGWYNVTPPITTGITRLGYSTEWLLHGTGKMREDQKASLLVTETQMIRMDVDTLRQETKLKIARQTGYEKQTDERMDKMQAQIDNLERLVSELKKEIKNGVNPV